MTMFQVDKSGPLAEAFTKLWTEACAKSDDPSLIMVCLRLFKSTYLTSVFIRMLGDSLAFVSPFCIGAIITYVKDVQVSLIQIPPNAYDLFLQGKDYAKRGLKAIFSILGLIKTFRSMTH